ncbi:MAG: metallophosphoesterase [Clostridiales bacterium]|jgi:predicted MPP superfamily phosphohydrolase|nr:metallophosphoesterase [Clostridiales bacterium]
MNLSEIFAAPHTDAIAPFAFPAALTLPAAHAAPAASAPPPAYMAITLPTTPARLAQAALLALIAVAALAMLWLMRREAARLTLETISLADAAPRPAAGPEAGHGALAPGSGGDFAGGGGLRIVHISDIHLKLLRIPLPAITEAMRRAAPDVVMLTGDYLCSPKDAAPFLEWISALTDEFAGADFFLCFGNHDFKAFKDDGAGLAAYEKELEKRRVAVLENKTAVFTRNGSLYSVTGFRDLSREPVNPTPAYVGVPDGARFRIGITHNPDLALSLRPESLDLLLCGHFHGGQIWLPFNIQYTCLRGEKLCRIGVCKGLHDLGGLRVYISRGLGCVLFPLRFRAKPEIALIVVP